MSPVVAPAVGDSSGIVDPTIAGSADRPVAIRLYKEKAIHEYYWPDYLTKSRKRYKIPKDATTSDPKDEDSDADSISSMTAEDGSDSMYGEALHSSRMDPNRLKYIIVDREEQPLWEDEVTIYAHARLHLLPDFTDHTGGAGATTRLIAVFGQKFTRGDGSRYMTFLGYYRVKSIKHIAAHSLGVVDLINSLIKWRNKLRGREGVGSSGDVRRWLQGSSKDWAAVKLRRSESASRQLPQPDVPSRYTVTLSPDLLKDPVSYQMTIHNLLGEMQAMSHQ